MTTRGPGNEPTEWQLINGPVKQQGKIIKNDDPRQLLHAHERVNVGNDLYLLGADGFARYIGPNDRRHRTWQP